MPVCLIAGGKATAIALASFTLAWTHSVEKLRWEEDWALTEAGALQLVGARVKGSGAGMEVPDGAVLTNGVWHYRPSLPPQKALLLARSGMTDGGWEICAEDICVEIGRTTGAPAEIRACAPGEPLPGDAQ
ncbi:MAG: DUF1850 domain-containing protein [Mesorhizobium sp.]|nr:DUF1850 domain-containing protein [Mesorhizobium sp.]MCO5161227.1 DUF1850 domain-containing protein [Mesorhizobium sp.]